MISTNKCLAFTLAVLLAVSMIPVSVSAHHAEEGDGPPHENTWNGNLACSAGSSLASLYLAACGAAEVVGPDVGDEFLHEFTIKQSDTLEQEMYYPEAENEPFLKSIVVAIEWEPSADSTTDELRLSFDKRDFSETYEAVEGTSPLEFRVDAADVDQDWAEEVAFRVFAVGGPGGVAIDQPFTVHYDLFYNETAPEDHSALDG